jgi:hypothetical protein
MPPNWPGTPTVRDSRRADSAVDSVVDSGVGRRQDALVPSEVRDLVRQIQQRPSASGRLDLFVEPDLTLDGSSIDPAVGMAIVLDAALGESLMPKGFTQTHAGRVYHYDVKD